MERKDYVVVIDLLVLAARREGATSRTKRDIRALYEYLWHNHTPAEEVEAKQRVEAILA